MYARIPTINTSNTVARTVAKKIIEDLKSNLSIDNKAFIALENIFDTKTFTSGINVSIDKNEYEMPLAERILAKIDNNKANEYNVGSIINDAKELFNNGYIAISTEFINYEMTITITYQTMSKVNADELVNYLRDHGFTRGGGYTHLVDYYYLIPDVLLGLMEDIFTASKKNIDDGTNFIDFIKSGNIRNAIVLTSDINGFDGDVGLAAIASNRINGIFDIEIRNPEKEFDTSTNKWSVPVTYKINYKYPDSLIVDYSLLINNAMIPAKYYIQKSDHAVDPKRVKDLLPSDEFNIMSYKEDYVAIPPYDNHMIKVQNSKVLKPILCVLSAISTTDKTTLFNLTDLHYYKIKDEYIQYMKDNHTYLTTGMSKGFHNIFTLDIYEDKKLLSKSILTVDNELNISSNIDLDITKVYRVVLSVLVDFSLLSSRGNSSIKPLQIENKIDSVIDAIKHNDYRIADSDNARCIIPVNSGSMLTAQNTIIKTFFKE